MPGATAGATGGTEVQRHHEQRDGAAQRQQADEGADDPDPTRLEGGRRQRLGGPDPGSAPAGEIGRELDDEQGAGHRDEHGQRADVVAEGARQDTMVLQAGDEDRWTARCRATHRPGRPAA